MHNFDKTQWDDLSVEQKTAAEALGLTKEVWPPVSKPKGCDANWSNLSEDKKKAAKTLGWVEETWNTKSKEEQESLKE